MSSIRWIPVVGYEDRYEISTAGEVRIKTRDIFDKNNEYVTTLKPKILEIQKDNVTKRPYVILYNGLSYHKAYVQDLLNEAKKVKSNT